MNFRFVGTINTGENWYRSGTTKSGNPYASINFSISSAKNNRAFVELFGMEGPIKTKDLDFGNIEIDYDDRLDKDVIASVNSMRKHIVSVGEERNEFIAAKDVCTFFKEHIDDFKEGKYVVTGDVKPDVYNGKVRDRYQIRNIYPATDDKTSLTVSGEFFYTPSSFDTDDWKSEKKLYINGWTHEWVDGEMKYVPKQIIFDCSKVDFDNERNVELVNFNLSQLGCELKDDKIKVKIKGKNVFSQNVICSYINGAEEIPFDENELTDNQKLAIKLGRKTLDDFRPSGSIYGNRVTYLKLIDFTMKGKWSKGCLETDVTQSDLEDEVLIVDMEDEDGNQFMNKPEKDEEEKEDSKPDIMDLFG